MINLCLFNCYTKKDHDPNTTPANFGRLEPFNWKILKMAHFQGAKAQIPCGHI